MPTVEETIHIPKAPEEVFEYIIAPGSQQQWNSAIIHSEQIDDGPVRLGTRFKGQSKVLGRTFDWTTELVEFDPPRRIVSRTVEGDLNFTVTQTLEAEDAGTRFTERVDAESGLGGIFGKLTDSLVQRAYAHSARANLKTLVEILTEEA